MNRHTPRIALVGDRSANVRAHARIPALIDALLTRESRPLDPYWIATPDAAEDELAGFDAIWVAPGSPYRSSAGAITAVRTARMRGIPFLGTCGGFQHAMLEFARDVCGMPSARHAENGGDGDALITELSCSLAGHEGGIELTAGTLISDLLGAGRTVER